MSGFLADEMVRTVSVPFITVAWGMMLVKFSFGMYFLSPGDGVMTDAGGRIGAGVFCAAYIVTLFFKQVSKYAIYFDLLCFVMLIPMGFASIAKKEPPMDKTDRAAWDAVMLTAWFGTPVLFLHFMAEHGSTAQFISLAVILVLMTGIGVAVMTAKPKETSESEPILQEQKKQGETA
mmetsp:Transcript_95433/g.169434  ORF Transcript_95433/g.169434 Transcript_95433/m.169434 type:complete len:177 (+) Transcript_95433:53-583(+)|eukprot:CAMPEP_0197636664 /NCGR_PEP_ID=MMETSP1338-20131121/12099_1 /TAXON_ID=43686 ORGANISM="Pelagodinium beii, Strain RCC1491" /NCGR_SAMPLE_ID=MMETSP1338 /ASSEMBLY_ACC=CAM_ASM_000754 /LENGTH=176 /DNA_ID=CAMNT_0043208933 /DNA_START=53 /DNA_END=583 /DNA_ORIENTATION=-